MTKKECSRLLLSLILIVLLMAMMIFMSSVETNYYSDYTTNRYATLSSSCSNTPSDELIKYFNTSTCKFEMNEYDSNGNLTGEKYVFDEIRQKTNGQYIGIISMKVEQDNWIYYVVGDYEKNSPLMPFIELSFYNPVDNTDREIKYLQSITLSYNISYTDKHGFLWLSSTEYTETETKTIDMGEYESGKDNPITSFTTSGIFGHTSDLKVHKSGGYRVSNKAIQSNTIYRKDSNTFLITLDDFGTYEDRYSKKKFDEIGDIKGSVIDFEYVLDDLVVDEINADIQEQYYQLIMNVTNDDTLTYEEKMIKIAQLQAQYSDLNLTYDQILSNECGDSIDDECAFYIEPPVQDSLSDLLLGVDFSSISNAFRSLLTIFFIVAVILVCIPLIPVIWPIVISFIKSVFGLVRPMVMAIYRFIVDLLTWFINWLTSGLLPVFQKHVPKIWTAFKDLIYNIGQTIATMWNGTIDFFRKYGSTVWKQFKALMSEIGQFIHQVWLQIKGFFTGFRK